MTLGIAGKEAEVIVLRTTESEDGFEMFVKLLPVVTTIHSKRYVQSRLKMLTGPNKFIYVSSKDYNIYLSTIQNDGAAFINPSCK
jgi:hypothetical protein